MASRKQIEANRRNSSQSTGPATAEGMAKMSLKPLRDVLSRHIPLVTTENREKFQQLCDEMEAEWQPRTRTEQIVLEFVVVCRWKLACVTAALEQDTGEHGMKKWERLMKYQSQLQTSYSRSVRDLKRLQKMLSPRAGSRRLVTAARVPKYIAAELHYEDFAYHDSPPPQQRRPG